MGNKWVLPSDGWTNFLADIYLDANRCLAEDCQQQQQQCYDLSDLVVVEQQGDVTTGVGSPLPPELSLGEDDILEGISRKQRRLQREAKMKEDESLKRQQMEINEKERRLKVKKRSQEFVLRNERIKKDRELAQLRLHEQNEETKAVYPGPIIPEGDEERVAALESYSFLGVKDSPIDENFKRLTSIASNLLQVPIAFISFISRYQVNCMAVQGMETKQLARNMAFCSHAIIDKGSMFVIKDTLLDKRFVHHPLVVNSPYIRFYAGIPLTSSNGHRIGLLCVADTVPRQDVDQHKCSLLQTLAAVVQHDIDLNKLIQDKLKNDQLQKSLVEFNTRYDIKYKIDEIFDNACLTIMENVDLDCMELFLRAEDKWRLKSCFGLDEFGLEDDPSLIDYVTSTMQPFVVDNIASFSNLDTAPPVPKIPERYLRNNIKSMLCVPIRSENSLYGMIGLYLKTVRSWQEYEIDYTNSFGETLAKAIELENWQFQLSSERRKSDDLLHNILPHPISTRLKSSEKYIAERIPNATILFCDLVGFTKLTSYSYECPTNLVSFLNTIFSAFDRMADKYDLEKIKTIGDAYMLSGGLLSHEDDHAVVVMDMAIEMLDYIHSQEVQDLFYSLFGNTPYTPSGKHPIDVRIGIGSGPVVAGVIGLSKFSYDLWGNAVNVASRMESCGVPGRIQICESTRYRIPPDVDRFKIEERGVIDVKGKGKMRSFFVSKAETTSITDHQ